MHETGPKKSLGQAHFKCSIQFDDLDLNHVESLGPMEIIKETQPHPNTYTRLAHRSPKINKTKSFNRKWKHIACMVGHNDNDNPNSRKRLVEALIEGFSSK